MYNALGQEFQTGKIRRVISDTDLANRRMHVTEGKRSCSVPAFEVDTDSELAYTTQRWTISPSLSKNVRVRRLKSIVQNHDTGDNSSTLYSSRNMLRSPLCILPLPNRTGMRSQQRHACKYMHQERRRSPRPSHGSRTSRAVDVYVLTASYLSLEMIVD